MRDQTLLEDGAKVILDEFLAHIRQQFFPDAEKRFYQQKFMISQAITYPAAWLKKREVRIPASRHRAILTEIVTGIKRHGDTARIQQFGRYFLHAVQEHMKHHGEEYYEEGKSFRSALEEANDKISAKMAKKVEQAKDPTTEHLALIHNAIKGRTRRKPAPVAKQMSLL